MFKYFLSYKIKQDKICYITNKVGDTLKYEKM